MSSVPELQQKLFKRMGLGMPEQNQGRKSRDGRNFAQPLGRKDQRKAQRVQKRTQRYSRPPTTLPSRPTPAKQHRNGGDSSKSQFSTPSLKKTLPSKPVESDDDEYDEYGGMGSFDVDDEMDSLEEEDDEVDDGEDDEEDDEEDDASMSDLDSTLTGRQAARNGVPTAVKERLDQDDAEIAAFERKLGLKKGRKSLPQSFKDDGLEDLMGEVESDVDDSDIDEPNKRKREYDDWLSSKRRKANAQSNGTHEDDSNGNGSNAEDDDDFEGFDSDLEEATPRERENPYVAPSTGSTGAKYVPPSLRKVSGSDTEARTRLQKQVQGLINRLTDANILSVVQSAEELYQKNARGAVTEVLTDAILAQICKPETMPDQFFVLTGGFAAAIYKITGSSFGSHLVRRVVKDFGDQYDKADREIKDGQPTIRKEPSNLMTFITQLYVFEVVSCKIIFDYMERLLSDLTELNVELLLRVCRMAGRLLRKDDPLALKHVSSALSKAVAKLGYENVSARTKFMIETITDLKHSKKARGMDSALVSDHVLRMKKRLGELKSQSRRLDGTAPMGTSLEDIEDADTKGKWWLVGASVPAKQKGPGPKDDARNTRDDRRSADLSDNEDMDIVLPDYPKKARAQGLQTTAQISIFTALMSAMNYEHGYRQFVNLRLKKDDQLEIARVLVQCVGSETQYNEYYALIARQACSNGRIRFALQNRLWKIFKALGESLFGEEGEDDETAEGERMKEEQRMSNVSRFYASLVAEGVLGIAILKPLDLPEMNSWTGTLVERLMINLLQQCRGKGADEDAKIEKVFGAARELPVLAVGIHWFLRKRVRKTKLVGSKEAKRLDRVREKAQAVVQAT